MPSLPHLVLLCLATASLCGQQRSQEVRPGERTTIDSYSESRSRELFRACDADGDDRLDVFEATETIEGLGEVKEAAAFRRIDNDRDGYITWPEFDQHYRSVLQTGRALRLRPARRLPAVTAPSTNTAVQKPQSQPAVLRFLQLYDRNQDGGLDPAEVEAWVKQVELKPQLASQLRALDADRSGKLEATELELFFRNTGIESLLPGMPVTAGPLPLPGLPLTAGAAPAAPLPAPWNSTDLDQDGQLDRSELAHWLRQLDTGLVRWAGPILDRLDNNRDSKLQAAELGIKPVIAKPAVKPKT